MKAIDYLREHEIEGALQEFIGLVVHERPDDPFGVLVNCFASRAQPPTVARLRAREVLLSTSRPTIQIDVFVRNLGREYIISSAAAPLGISAFTQEYAPLVDTSATRYLGQGSRNCFPLVDVLSNAVQGQMFTTIDQFDITIKKVLDSKGSPVNILCAASFALAKASSKILKQPLFIYLYESLYPQQSADTFSMPIPAVTVLEGGLHSDSPLLFESIFIIPKQSINFVEQLRMCSEVNTKLRDKLDKFPQKFGQTGAQVPDSQILVNSIVLVERAIIEAGFSPGSDLQIGIDCAASHFYDQESQKYKIENGVTKTAAELVQFYIDLVAQHQCISMINDPMSEVDHAGWELIKTALTGRIKVFGGDIYASQSILARRGLKKGWTNGIFVQPAQAGTISDAASAARLFKQKGKLVAISRRAGETCDTLITDLAVSIQSDYFIGGGLSRSDSNEKYNNLVRIYEYLKDRSMLS